MGIDQILKQKYMRTIVLQHPLQASRQAKQKLFLNVRSRTWISNGPVQPKKAIVWME